MKKWRLQFPLKTMSRVFNVSRSGFYAWFQRKPSRRVQMDDRLKVAITGSPWMVSRWKASTTSNELIAPLHDRMPVVAVVVAVVQKWFLRTGLSVDNVDPAVDSAMGFVVLALDSALDTVDWALDFMDLALDKQISFSLP